MDKKMKIGINSRIYQQANTGIPYFIKKLYEELLSKNNYNYVFFQTNDKKTIGKTKIISWANKSFLYPIFDMFLVNRLASKEKINIFHGTSYILPFFKKKNIKYLVTIHDLSFKIFPKNHSKIFNIYYSLGVKRSLKNADKIISDSESTKKDIIKYYKTDSKKIKVIHLGVNNVFFKRDKRPRIIKEKYLFSITTHPKRKNIFSILEILSKEKCFPDLKYVIAGCLNESNLEELKEKIKALNIQDQVILYGYASEKDLINLYQNAEFFIYPSFYEGFGFPVLEAMACKCPVITSNNSSLTEITPSKKWLIDPNNLEDIKSKMKQIINLSEKGKKELIDSNYSFAKKFTWNKTANEYNKIFQELI